MAAHAGSQLGTGVKSLGACQVVTLPVSILDTAPAGSPPLWAP